MIALCGSVSSTAWFARTLIRPRGERQILRDAIQPLLAMMSTSPKWRLAPSPVLSTLAGVLAAAHRKPFFEP
jgi:hypothetical protein